MRIVALVLSLTIVVSCAGTARTVDHTTTVVCPQLAILEAFVASVLTELGADVKYALAVRVVFAGAAAACASSSHELPPATEGGL